MLIGAGIITLITVLLLGGKQNELIFIDFQKEAKTVVQDESRYSDIKDINKEFEALKKDYGKKGKNFAKEFKALLGDQATTLENFTHYLDEVIKLEEVSGEQYIAIREKVQDRMTEAEWNEMMDNLTKEIEKTSEKTEKTLSKYNGQMSGFSESILKSVDKEETKIALEASLNTFEERAMVLAEKMVVYDEREIQVLKSYKPSTKELNGVLLDYNNELKEFYTLIFELHQNLAKETSAKEWKRLSKELLNI